MNMDVKTARMAQARYAAEKWRGHITAKGFKAAGDLRFTRVDADLMWDDKARAWTVTIWTTEGRDHLKVLTIRKNPVLPALLKSFF